MSKKDLRESIAKLHKADAKTVIVYGFSTAFGGGRSSGFGLIYDSVADMKSFEPKHRLARVDLGTKKVRTRKQWKDLKKKKRTSESGLPGSLQRQSGACTIQPLARCALTQLPFDCLITIPLQLGARGAARRLARPRRRPRHKRSASAAWWHPAGGRLVRLLALWLGLFFCIERGRWRATAQLVSSPASGDPV